MTMDEYETRTYSIGRRRHTNRRDGMRPHLLRHFLLNRCRKRKSNWTGSFLVNAFVSRLSHSLGVGSIHHPTDKGDISL